MSFFDSEIVQDEIASVIALQENLSELVYTFPIMSKEEKLTHIDNMMELISKQQILYTRMKLSDDPEAHRIKDLILESARGYGFSEDVDLGCVFSKMLTILEKLKSNLDDYED